MAFSCSGNLPIPTSGDGDLSLKGGLLCGGVVPTLSFSGSVRSGLSLNDGHVPIPFFSGSIRAGFSLDDGYVPIASMRGELLRQIHLSLSGKIPCVRMSTPTLGFRVDAVVPAISFNGRYLSEQRFKLSRKTSFPTVAGHFFVSKQRLVLERNVALPRLKVSWRTPDDCFSLSNYAIFPKKEQLLFRADVYQKFMLAGKLFPMPDLEADLNQKSFSLTGNASIPLMRNYGTGDGGTLRPSVFFSNKYERFVLRYHGD